MVFLPKYLHASRYIFSLIHHSFSASGNVTDSPGTPLLLRVDKILPAKISGIKYDFFLIQGLCTTIDQVGAKNILSCRSKTESQFSPKYAPSIRSENISFLLFQDSRKPGSGKSSQSALLSHKDSRDIKINKQSFLAP
jgi:hypothetical protein